MSKNCGHSVPCGCADQALTTAPPCNDQGDCSKEPCSEVFCQECIVYCQNDMAFSIGGNTFSLAQGARLDEALQKLMVFLNNPSCSENTAVALRVGTVTYDEINITWKGSIDNVYTVTWQEGVNIYTQDVDGGLSYKIQNLLPDTTYTIYIQTKTTICVSVELTVKTKPI